MPRTKANPTRVDPAPTTIKGKISQLAGEIFGSSQATENGHENGVEEEVVMTDTEDEYDPDLDDKEDGEEDIPVSTTQAALKSKAKKGLAKKLGGKKDEDKEKKVGKREQRKAKGLKQTHCKPGTLALREIKKQQKDTGSVFRRAPLVRFIREIAQDVKTDVRFSPDAIEALLEATQDYGVDVMNDANFLAIHSKRSTVKLKDLRGAVFLRSKHGSGYTPEGITDKSVGFISM